MKRMKLRIKLIASMAVIGAISVQCAGGGGDSANSDADKDKEVMAEAPLIDPNSPKQTCVVSETEFATWFSGGAVTKDGWVNPANSLTVLDSDCDFYKWSWQMFLWNLSPKNGSVAFDQPPFYDLEGSDLVQNGTGTRVRGGKVEAVGQAGVINGVLMSQDYGIAPNGSLVYYAIHVNDVYAYFASGKNSGALTDIDEFPTTQDQLDQIVNYAKETYNATIDDANALTLELKSSWVKADPSLDLSKYVTIVADVPQYVKESDTKWTWDGTSLEEGVTLALVGYHVVGSVADHPEMVWATFEHVNNVPDANYYYTNAEGNVVQATNFNADGYPVESDWLFNSSSVKMNANNQMFMETGYNNPNNIVATPNNTISASSTFRTHPFGNTADEASAENNTLILSLNGNIADMLADGDVRANYFLVGATWTSNGVIPGVGNQLPVVAGSKVLANSTMETYFQFKNCFDCHEGGKIDSLSHIFAGITPLTPATP